MDTLETIESRRSIRIYEKRSIPKEIIEKLLRETLLAPSGHNRQPWRFLVVQNEKKFELEELLMDVCTEMINAGKQIGTFKRTIGCIKRSDVIILVFKMNEEEEMEQNVAEFYNLMDVQAIGGAVQTLLLSACSLGIGSLWIGDILHAREEIAKWCQKDEQLIAGVCLGYPDEKPNARPRKNMEEIVEWL